VERIAVRVVEVRAADVLPGDVVNRQGHVRDGWIEVDRVERLPDGNLLVSDRAEKLSFTSRELDLVWLQLPERFDG